MIIKIKNLHVGGIALFPFILIKSGLSQDRLRVLINHEKIHLRQQVELLIIPFYLFYLMNYLVLLVVYKNHTKAYRNILFEKEAFKYEGDLDYLNRRKVWSYLRKEK